MALIDISTTALNTSFRSKVKGSMIKTAVVVLGEVLTPTKQILLDKRHNLAYEILNFPDSKLEAFCWAIAQHPTITILSIDTDIDTTLLSVFNDIAGVKNSEL